MLNRRRLHNRIAESVFTLPVCALLCLALTFLNAECGMQHAELGDALSLLQSPVACVMLRATLLFLTAYVILETNNVHQLIRVRTRLMASLWLLLAPLISTTPLPAGEGLGGEAALCLAICHFLLFQCYQRSESAAWFFHITLVLSLGSLCCPPLVVFALPCYFYMAMFMRSMSMRTCCAGLLGLILPYFFWAVGAFLADAMPSFLARVEQMAVWPAPSLAALSRLTTLQLTTWAVLAVYTLVGLVHYWRSNYNDKIHVRMKMYVFVVQSLLLHALLLLRPDCFAPLCTMLLVSTTPLLAHYFAVTRTRLSLVVFWLSTLLYVALLTMCLLI